MAKASGRGMSSTVGAFNQVNRSDVQRSDQQSGAQEGNSPTGESVLYKANPESSITPLTMGYTTSKNQLTVSGK
jgi:hypothetical protein